MAKAQDKPNAASTLADEVQGGAAQATAPSQAAPAASPAVESGSKHRTMAEIAQSDPVMAELMAELRSMRETIATQGQQIATLKAATPAAPEPKPGDLRVFPAPPMDHPRKFRVSIPDGKPAELTINAVPGTEFHWKDMAIDAYRKGIGMSEMGTIHPFTVQDLGPVAEQAAA